MAHDNTKKASDENIAILQNLITRVPISCSCYEAVFDDQGFITDYIIVSMNNGFEQISGLANSIDAGKRITRSFTTIEAKALQHILEIGNLAYQSEKKTACVNISIFNHPYKATFIYISNTLMLGFYEDIQPQVYRKFYKQAIPYEIIAQNISFQLSPNQIHSLGNPITPDRSYSDTSPHLSPLSFLPQSFDFKEHGDTVFHDSLTGLYDRFFITNALKMYIDMGLMPLSIALGDVNGLKAINDSMGYETGDKLLFNIATILRENSRSGDIIGRWGDDEFILILPNTTAKDTQLLLAKLQPALSKLCDNPDRILMTFGYAVNDKKSRPAAELIRQAEKWTYSKKLLVTQSYRNSIIRLLLSTLHETSADTQEHSDRMAKYCRYIAEKLGLSNELLNDLILLSMLHDIGKVGIRHAILNKPGPLTPEERHEIQAHPEIGYRITQNIPELSQVSRYILAHHERWDGKGYPNGLHSIEIPVASRIIAVVDAYDVMVSGRSYQPAKTEKEALDELKRCAGSQFDPGIVAIFAELIEKKALCSQISEHVKISASPQINTVFTDKDL